MNFLALPKCGFGLACKMCSFLGSRCQSRGRNRGVFFCLPQAKYLEYLGLRLLQSAYRRVVVIGYVQYSRNGRGGVKYLKELFLLLQGVPPKRIHFWRPTTRPIGKLLFRSARRSTHLLLQFLQSTESFLCDDFEGSQSSLKIAIFWEFFKMAIIL